MVESARTKERPILFSGQMVRAILDGKKTQTRRVVKFGVLNPGVRAFMRETVEAAVSPEGKRVMANYIHLAYKCPYGKPGDRLWVRETWRAFLGDDPRVEYAAGGTTNLDWENTDAWLKEARQFNELPSAVESGLVQQSEVTRWRPSIHMPRWASRIALEVLSVRVERLNEISSDDAIAEMGWIHNGTYPTEFVYEIREFSKLWESINGSGSWATNPWVWVVEFKRVQGDTLAVFRGGV